LLRAVVASAKSSEAFAVFCIDLDRFKELNDTYGHDVGDEAIRVAASRLASFEAQAARLDGDGFALLVTNTTKEATIEFARNLIESLAEPLQLSIGSRLVGGSVGVALSDHHLHEPLEMLRRADMALFRAKAEGRACYRFFDEQMDMELKNKRTLKEDLRTAIATGKLYLVYQPQVRLSGEVVGVEALVRWDHDVLGPVSPTLFVPLAEESGLIHALGDYTLRKAALDGLRWPGVKTAVNVSATQLQSPGFAERVKRIVTETGAETSAIEIELTEGVLYANENQMRTALDDLHAAGFSIALDHFGTGYSSLSYLPRFPIDKIKIDRSFVIDLGRDAKADVLFEAIVKLAQTLGMRVIAEGVETQDQWLRLSAAGCPKVQGYVASRPLTADGVAIYIAGATCEAQEPTASTVHHLHQARSTAL
jgi:diguanylate cyclase (GGDEF)-like protein